MHLKSFQLFSKFCFSEITNLPNSKTSNSNGHAQFTCTNHVAVSVAQVPFKDATIFPSTKLPSIWWKCSTEQPALQLLTDPLSISNDSSQQTYEGVIWSNVLFL
ncbi:hypothetical protein CHARACLAT_024589 [Characodon lateralis]|uniref:Uncharacterized protein n=1 Tax=Characodon lateralis TaxID=208331 RepID=A0ABU7E356_9TELE|nr:hypothetical protein [Characodon lateralis]